MQPVMLEKGKGHIMARKPRTAVLVVHGIGSQRPLETVRGIINAVWFDDDDHKKGKKKLWSHPERSGVDIDLTVMTTSGLKASSRARSIDFHELYWAHQMSETKAVAVLLWLFELCRKGPRFKPGMNALWYFGAIFLALLHLSAAVIILRGITWLASTAEHPERMIYTPILMLFIASFFTALAALLARTRRLAFWSALPALAFAFAAALAYYGHLNWGWSVDPHMITLATNVFLPVLLVVIAIAFVMDDWGLFALLIAYGLSWAFFFIYYFLLSGHFGIPAEQFADMWARGRLPWSLTSPTSAVAAWVVIGLYIVVNAWFLQPYLGDAARYFRNSPANVAVRRAIRKEAVDTLDSLHASGYYDRIVVVAHSLGCVVAYDMLRAYYSRICDLIPITKSLDPEFKRIDVGKLTRAQLRKDARVLVSKIAESHKQPRTMERGRVSSGEGPHTWLVTDFVTLGNALTHAHYLMCDGYSMADLDKDFARRVDEREFPTCPPKKDAPDGWLAFTYPQTDKKQLHHGGLFALTRWTNIYFPLKQVFWGDAIGGPVGSKDSVFGSHIEDIEVWTDASRPNGLFTHTKYWDTKYKEGRKAPHIQALIDAIDLPDKNKVPAPVPAARQA